jgi:hypothetical protein
MTPEHRAIETMILQQNAVRYWHVVDMTGGAGVSEMFIEDGIFHAGPGQPLIGRAAIEEFYGWRQDRGPRTSRHLIVNFHAEFVSDSRAVTHCVMLLLADDGVPIHESKPPIFVGDQIDHCVKGDDGVWRYAERDFRALFMGGAAPTIPPADIAERHSAKGE